MLFKSLLAVALFSANALACEPLCRHGVANAFAGFYGPVVELAVKDLHTSLESSLTNVTVPAHLKALVPEDALHNSIQNDLSAALNAFVDHAKGKHLEDGIYKVMFAEADPFKGDCNAPPRRLTRNMPPAGESWTREECKSVRYASEIRMTERVASYR